MNLLKKFRKSKHGVTEPAPSTPVMSSNAFANLAIASAPNVQAASATVSAQLGHHISINHSIHLLQLGRP